MADFWFIKFVWVTANLLFFFQNTDRIAVLGEGPDVINDSCNIKCNDSAKFRPFDGSCNNRQNPCWGKSYRTFTGLLPKQYADGIGCPTIEVTNSSPLPSTRLVSRIVHHSKYVQSKKLSQVFTTFGQFQAHDTGQSPVANENKTYDCPSFSNTICKNNIVVPAGDEYFPSPGCLGFKSTKSYICNGIGATCGCTTCKPGQNQFLNVATAFMDGSNIYGANEERAEQLRVPGTAFLRMDGKLLARTKHPEASLFPCTTSNGCNSTCFDMGDIGGNMNFPLIAMYTTWFNEHNRLVDKLKVHISDPEVLFQEVRKIIGAMMQHVTHSEYLPLIFGTCMPSDLKIHSEKVYDDSVDPTVTSECNFAACRYGHSEIKSFPTILGNRKQISIGQFARLDMFCENDIIKRITGGLLLDKTMEMDEYVSSEVLNKMSFPTRPPNDLIATGLQRARDEGVASYIQMFEYCGLRAPEDYEQLKHYINEEAVENYRKVYGEKGMINIDLYSAILSEKPIPNCGGILGYITSCIVEDHHRRIKLGDRLWYENLNQPESFTKEQILEIQKTTMSRILCSNTGLTSIQNSAFKISSSSNLKTTCKQIIDKSDIDGSKWKQRNSVP